MFPGMSKTGPQYIEDLATAYWYSQALFTAVELELFTVLEPGAKTAEELVQLLDLEPRGLTRFLQALCALGLLGCDNQLYYNTKISADYLVAGKINYQGDSVLWRKNLSSSWQGLPECLKVGGRVQFGSKEEEPEVRAARISKYISAMDGMARTKVPEILAFFEGIEMKGKLLDVGAGSGAIAAGFLRNFPKMTATLLDLEEILEYTGEKILKEELKGEITKEAALQGRVTLWASNILEDWSVDRESFELVVLSNIVHAYAEEEISYILRKAAASLKPGGFLLIHDFFMEHFPEKAALFDLNMFINTYNGKVFSSSWVNKEIKGLNFYTTGLIPLQTDTAVIIASNREECLSKLKLNPVDHLAAVLRNVGFDALYPITVEIVQVADWVDVKCRFGCKGYGKPYCPPNSLSPQKTKNLLKDYTRAILLKGQPPTKDFQLRVLEAEKAAFKAGFYKALAFWAGSCTICDSCAGYEAGICRNTANARPSMEGSGIDVFATVRRAGLNLEVLQEKDDYVTYFALLLLD